MKELERGIYVVATPIGNLGDITHRAVKVLSDADYIAAEDTRQTRKLLDHLGIDTKMIALHEHNEREKANYLVGLVADGACVALVSDAGTPLISDPGHHLVQCARANDAPLFTIPGPCAVIAALSISGIACGSFIFEGFLPSKSGARRLRFEGLSEESRTVVYYESPHRILETLALLAEIYPERLIAVARELTKTFETVLSGASSDVYARVADDPNQRKGEFVLVISGAQVEESQGSLSPDDKRLAKRISADLPPKKAAALTADLYGLNKKSVYEFLVKGV
jgi:16S rRNA (cytidine1402-2'-O)-methyltransferase